MHARPQGLSVASLGCRFAPLAVAALLLGGCGWVRWGAQRVTEDEMRLDGEIRDYYAAVQRAFAAGNPQALSSLFDASITTPMTKAGIEAWAEKFFAENGRAAFHVVSYSLEDLGRERAVVLLRYSVKTPDGRGDFAGAERDTLVKRSGRWYTAAWEKLP